MNQDKKYEIDLERTARRYAQELGDNDITATFGQDLKGHWFVNIPLSQWGLEGYATIDERELEIHVD